MTSMHAMLEYLQSLSIPTGIREDGWSFQIIESVHVLAITFVVGTVIMVDLRLLGLSSRARAVSRLTTEILPWTWAGFVVALLSGGLMFSSAALKYFDNLPFRIKLLMMVMAGVNMAIFHFTTARNMEQWDDHPSPPHLAKLAGGLSITCWLGVIAAGRWIGFSDF